MSLALGLGPLNFLLAIASFGGAFVVTGLPDDSVTDVALQTLIAVPLATLFPVLFGGLGPRVVEARLGALLGNGAWIINASPWRGGTRWGSTPSPRPS